jgi:CBS domain-containing protein
MEEKRVKDVMLSLREYATIHSEATISEALLALSKSQMGLTYDRHHHRAILVLDDRGQVIGKLSHWAILRSLEPKLLREEDLHSLSRAGVSQEFISSITRSLTLFHGGLARLCREAAKVRVKEAMVPLGESIDEEAPLTEAIHLLIRSHAQSTVVTRECEVIGILRLSDVFEEVADLIRSSTESPEEPHSRGKNGP